MLFDNSKPIFISLTGTPQKFRRTQVLFSQQSRKPEQIFRRSSSSSDILPQAQEHDTLIRVYAKGYGPQLSEKFSSLKIMNMFLRKLLTQLVAGCIIGSLPRTWLCEGGVIEQSHPFRHVLVRFGADVVSSHAMMFNLKRKVQFLSFNCRHRKWIRSVYVKRILFAYRRY